MNSVIRFFASVRLAIVLIILVTLAAILGTLIPQGGSAAEYAARYHGLAAPMMRLGLTGLYHSPGFILLLILFAVNLIVCSLVRLPAKLRRATRPDIEAVARLAGSKTAATYRVAEAPVEASAALRHRLEARRFRVRSAEREGRILLLGRKRSLGRFGSDFVHLGLLVILVGAIVTGLARVRSALPLRVGETAAAPGGGFRVRLDDFRTERYPNGSVKDWKSFVSVLPDGASAPALRAVVEVNRPLSFRGYSFYQMSYGWDWASATVRLDVKPAASTDGSAPSSSSPAAPSKTAPPAAPEAPQSLTLKTGQRVALRADDIDGLVVSEFVPDFVMDQAGRIGSRSSEPRNPAALVEGWKGAEKVFASWVFAKFPDFHGLTSGRAAGLTITLAGYEAPEYSVLEAVKDPGTGWVWTGCALVVLGLGLAFYWPPREIRAVVERDGGRTAVAAASAAAKSRDAAEAELRAIVDESRRER